MPSLIAQQVTAPFVVNPNTLISIDSGTAIIEYTSGTLSDVSNGVAVWKATYDRPVFFRDTFFVRITASTAVNYTVNATKDQRIIDQYNPDTGFSGSIVTSLTDASGFTTLQTGWGILNYIKNDRRFKVSDITPPLTDETITVSLFPPSATLVSDTNAMINNALTALSATRNDYVAFTGNTSGITTNQELFKASCITGALGYFAGIGSPQNIVGFDYSTPAGSGAFTFSGAQAFNTDSDKVLIWFASVNTSSMIYDVLVDGKRLSGSDAAGYINPFTANVSGGWQRKGIQLNFTTQKERLIEVQLASGYIGGISVPDYARVWGNDQPTCLLLCDSFGANKGMIEASNTSAFVNGGSGTFTPFDLGLGPLALRALGIKAFGVGQGGSGVTAVGVGNTYPATYLDQLNRTSELTLANNFYGGSFIPEYVWVFGSGNDTSASLATYQAKLLELYARIKALYPTAKIITTSIYTSFTATATVAIYNNILRPIAQANGIFIETGDDVLSPKAALWSGTGNRNTPNNTGKADKYLSAKGVSGNSHPHWSGIYYGAAWLANALSNAGVGRSI